MREEMQVPDPGMNPSQEADLSQGRASAPSGPAASSADGGTATGPGRRAATGPSGDAPARDSLAPGSTSDYYNQLLRLKAEFENFRKRVDRERPEWIRLGEAGLLEKLLPLYDLLLQAHDQVMRQAGMGGGSKELIQGLDLIFKEFNKVFEAEGVQPISAVGRPYHHDLHEAVGFVETDRHPEGTVAEELQRGYTFRGKVLRPVRVRIARPKLVQAEESSPLRPDSTAI